MQHAQVADRVGRALLPLVVAVQRVVREPQAEVVVELASEMLVRLGAIPIGLPRERLAVQQGLDHDHLPFESTGLHRPGRGRREQGAEHQRALGVQGRAVSVAELVPHRVVSGLGHLVSVIRLRRQKSAVVHDGGISRL